MKINENEIPIIRNVKNNNEGEENNKVYIYGRSKMATVSPINFHIHCIGSSINFDCVLIATNFFSRLTHSGLVQVV